ncbi:MAG: hypothetical protein JWR72_1019 [Flavisolibacter sp.]|jgi:hypothetical protein|nr:hypothetical protein [Flavisolibacter sp.]
MGLWFKEKTNTHWAVCVRDRSGNPFLPCFDRLSMTKAKKIEADSPARLGVRRNNHLAAYHPFYY